MDLGFFYSTKSLHVSLPNYSTTVDYFQSGQASNSTMGLFGLFVNLVEIDLVVFIPTLHSDIG